MEVSLEDRTDATSTKRISFRCSSTSSPTPSNSPTREAGSPSSFATIASTMEKSAIRCRVVDEGPGIRDEELKTVFDSFVQGKNTKTGKGGTGLGLAIGDHIIKAHGGRHLWAENASPKGTVFSFVIPKDHNGSGHPADSTQAGS